MMESGDTGVVQKYEVGFLCQDKDLMVTVNVVKKRYWWKFTKNYYKNVNILVPHEKLRECSSFEKVYRINFFFEVSRHTFEGGRLWLVKSSCGQ